MIPRIATAGASFRGAFDYYCHDKGARTKTRVAWTQTLNLLTDCAEKAWKVMAYTAKSADQLKEATGQRRTGRKLEKPVFSYSLSWHPEQKPSRKEMLEAANQSLAALGLGDHETMIAAHRDEPQPHVHVIVNRVHPLTGVAAKISHSKRKLSDWARGYEHEHGKVYCLRREENARKRQQGKTTRHADPVIVGAWEKSSDAQGFMAILETEGYTLAQGRKRLVVVDTYGKAHNPVRCLPGVRAGEFKERMDGLEREILPTVEEITARRGMGHKADERWRSNYEAKAAEALGAQRSEHRDEREKLRGRHNRKIAKEATDLSNFYKLDETQAHIAHLRLKLASPGLWQKFAFKVFRADRMLAERIGTLERNKVDAEWRIGEVIGKLEKERDRDLQQLEQRQAGELEQLTLRLAKWKPKERSLRREWSRTVGRCVTTRDHGNDGLSLGR